MTATVPVSITHKFSQLVAVFSDDPDDRYVQLFFDGGSLGRLNGIGGDDEIDWDSLGSASLGHADGPETGASGGPGDLPFAGGGLVGEIALFRFNNHALDAIEVSNRFDQIIGPCPWDCADRDGEIGIEEFLAVLGQWGTDGPCDFDGGGVGVADVHQLLGLWGPCP